MRPPASASENRTHDAEKIGLSRYSDFFNRIGPRADPASNPNYVRCWVPNGRQTTPNFACLMMGPTDVPEPLFCGSKSAQQEEIHTVVVLT